MNDPATTQSDAIMENLYVGSSGPSVEKLQQKLREQQLYLGPIDGLFGQGVEMAVKEFQLSRGFAVDGIAGFSTLVALGLMILEPEPEEPAQKVEESVQEQD